MKPLKNDPAKDAIELTEGERQKDYGHPLDNWERTVAIWNVVLSKKLKEPITPEEGAECMIGVKLARYVESPKYDTLLDIVGYARVVQMIKEERERRHKEKFNSFHARFLRKWDEIEDVEEISAEELCDRLDSLEDSPSVLSQEEVDGLLGNSSKEVIQARTTLSGRPPENPTGAEAPAPISKKTNQHRDYWVLSQDEISKGYLRPVRKTYKHRECGSITSMPLHIAQTYARKPDFYGKTFCYKCQKHLPLIQFDWWVNGKENGVLGK